MAKSRSVPTVNLSSFTAESNDESRNKCARALYQACHEYGFLQITGHGIEPEVLQEAFAWLERLYSLPSEDKMKAPHPIGPTPHRGYSHPGLEKVYSKAEAEHEDSVQTGGDSLRQIEDFKESYEIGSEDNIAQQNIWLPEDILPGFRSFMNTFYWKLHQAACQILEALSFSLQLNRAETQQLMSLHSGINNQLRLLHYPSIAADGLRPRVRARMPAHNDWSTFTMLFQDDCGGLEFEDPRNPGSFLAVKPAPGALALNVGDMLQRISNDIFPSASHRVTLPSQAISKNRTEAIIARDRYSIPYFVLPDDDKVVSCLPSCISAERPAKFHPVSLAEYAANASRYQYKRET